MSPLKILEEIRVELGEASALVPLGGRRFLVADDKDGLRIVDASGKKKPTSKLLVAAGDDERVAGIEGMCLCNLGQVIAVRERDSGVVWFTPPKGKSTKMDIRPKSDAAAQQTLPRPPKSAEKKNKGWEGLAYLDADLAWDKRGHLIGVHEGKPRSVGIFEWPTLKLERTIAIESGELAELLPDLSDVAVHRESGELWILSDESETIARARLTKKGELECVGSMRVPVEDGEKPEGIAFDDDNALWLVTDDTGRLLRLL